MLDKFFTTLKVFATVTLVASGLANVSIRPHGYLMILDAVSAGSVIYVIWFMGGRKPKEE